jgi:hypothetical protein
MASYLVLRPPGVNREPESVRFVKDGFSFAALVFPLIWMLFHRLWIYALAFFILQMALATAIELMGFGPAGTLALLALNLLVALESGEIRRSYMTARGWVLDAVVVADSIDMAEEIYFSSAEPAVRPAVATTGPARPGLAPAFGLFDTSGGR